MADNQDPLATLQKLLAEQKTESRSVSNHDMSENAQTPPVETVAGPTAEEIVLLQKKKEEEDRLEIEKQLKKMETELKETPQYQERLNQRQISETELAKKRLEERSKRIFQLKHLGNN